MLNTAMFLQPVNCMLGVKGERERETGENEKEKERLLPEWQEKWRGKKSMEVHGKKRNGT